MMKLVVPFRNFLKAPKNVSYKKQTEMGNRVNQCQTTDTSVNPVTLVPVSYFNYFCAVI